MKKKIKLKKLNYKNITNLLQYIVQYLFHNIFFANRSKLYKKTKTYLDSNL